MEKTGWNPACTTVNPAIDLSGGPFRIAKVSAQTHRAAGQSEMVGNETELAAHHRGHRLDSTQLAAVGALRPRAGGAARPTSPRRSWSEMTSLPNVQSQIALSSTILQLEMASGPDSRVVARHAPCHRARPSTARPW